MRSLFAELPEACDNTLWIAERANVEIEFGKPQAARLPAARGLRHRRRLPAPPHLRRRPRALRRPAAGRGRRAPRLRARRHRRHGLLGLLPRRVGPHPPRQEQRHPGRARAGERGGLLRGLLPAHRRPRPDPLRPALRALPQPGPQADARHRHGLRLALPRRDDPLRGRALRLGPRGPDRHLLHHQGPGRGARRARVLGYPYLVGDKIAKAMPPLVMGRDTPLRACFEKDPEVRRRLQDGRRAARHVRRRPRRQEGHRRGPRASRACAARTASTPPPWSSPASRSPSTCRSSASPSRAATSRTRRSSPSTRCTASKSSACSRWTSSGCATSR